MLFHFNLPKQEYFFWGGRESADRPYFPVQPAENLFLSPNYVAFLVSAGPGQEVQDLDGCSGVRVIDGGIIFLDRLDIPCMRHNNT